MLITFQVILLVTIVTAFFTALGVPGNTGDKAAGLCFASILAFTTLLLWA